MNGGNYFRGEFYGEGAIVWGTLFLGGNFPWGQLYRGQFSSGKIVWGQLSGGWGNHPAGNHPVGKYPGGNFPRGQLSGVLLLKVILTAADMRQIAIFVSFQKVLFSTLYISTSLAPTVSQIAAGQYL